MGRMAGCRAGSEGGHRGRQAEQRHAVQFEGRGTRVPLTRAEPRHLCQLPLILVMFVTLRVAGRAFVRGRGLCFEFWARRNACIGTHTRETKRPAPATLARAARRVSEAEGKRCGQRPSDG